VEPKKTFTEKDEIDLQHTKELFGYLLLTRSYDIPIGKTFDCLTDLLIHADESHSENIKELSDKMGILLAEYMNSSKDSCRAVGIMALTICLFGGLQHCIQSIEKLEVEGNEVLNSFKSLLEKPNEGMDRRSSEKV